MAQEMPVSATFDLEHVLCALQSVTALMDPDRVLDSAERGHLYFLLTRLTERPAAEPEPLSEALESPLWALQGVAALVDPDRALEGTARGDIATLLWVLTQRLARILRVLITERGILVRTLEQAQAAAPALAPEGAPHV